MCESGDLEGALDEKKIADDISASVPLCNQFLRGRVWDLLQSEAGQGLILWNLIFQGFRPLGILSDTPGDQIQGNLIRMDLKISRIFKCHGEF